MPDNPGPGLRPGQFTPATTATVPNDKGLSDQVTEADFHPVTWDVGSTIAWQAGGAKATRAFRRTDIMTTTGRLEGRYALITGASRVIGRAIAVRFAREGATVAINFSGSHDAAEETCVRRGSSRPAALRQASHDRSGGCR